MRLLATLALLALDTTAMAADPMNAFPPAEAGMTRYVISVPAQPDEYALRVELLIGRTVTTDARNRYFFGGQLEEETIQGWGYSRYILRELGPMAGTLIAVDPSEPRVERFIGLGGEPQLLRYNSRLPIVVYVPSDVQVRYRLWRAAADFAAAPTG